MKLSTLISTSALATAAIFSTKAQAATLSGSNEFTLGITKLNGDQVGELDVTVEREPAD
jgi:hypothetical protein